MALSVRRWSLTHLPHRRAPGEQVEPFRIKLHVPGALEEWCQEAVGRLREPELPPGVEDRAADIHEPLISIADAYGGPWPEMARAAAVFFTKANAEDEARSSGVELLAHIRDAFGDGNHLATADLLQRLINRDESPWATVRGGKEIDSRGLAIRLKGYGVRSKQVRIGEKTLKGYAKEDLMDAWSRYLPPDPKQGKQGKHLSNCNTLDVSDVSDVSDNRGKEGIPHPVYGHDPYSSIRLPQPALKPKEEIE